MSTFNELIDFTRSTTGTYLDSVVYGDELVTNGDFSNGTAGWISNTGNSAGGVPTISVNGNGQLQISSQNDDYGGANTEVNLTTGKKYTLSLDVISCNSITQTRVGTLDAAGSVSSTNIAYPLVLGSNSVTFTAAAHANYLYIGGRNDVNSLVIDNVSVKEVTGGQVSGTPLLRTAAINEPRLEYDASGNPLGLLIEEARSNVVTYSEDFSQSYWLKQSVTVAPTSVAAPDGTTSAYEMDMASNGMVRALTGYVPSVGQSYTASIWLKAGTASTVKLSILFNGSGLGMVTENFTLTNKWQRFDITSTVPSGTPDQVRYRIIASEAGSILVWGAQVETGAFPTSYIPTSGSTVTRAKDVTSLPVERFAYNQKKGTVIVNAEYFSTTNNVRFWEISNNTSDNFMAMYKQTPTSIAGYIATSSQQEFLQTVVSSSVIGTNYKLALAFATNNTTSTADGNSVVVDTSSLIPTVTKLHIGQRGHGNQFTLNGHIKHYPILP